MRRDLCFYLFLTFNVFLQWRTKLTVILWSCGRCWSVWTWKTFVSRPTHGTTSCTGGVNWKRWVSRTPIQTASPSGGTPGVGRRAWGRKHRWMHWVFVCVLGTAFKEPMWQENLPGQINLDFSKGVGWGGEGESTESMCRTDWNGRRNSVSAAGILRCPSERVFVASWSLWIAQHSAYRESTIACIPRKWLDKVTLSIHGWMIGKQYSWWKPDLRDLGKVEFVFSCITGLFFLFSLQETYEAKRNEFLGELQKKEEAMRQMFVQRVKEKEAELKEAEKEVSSTVLVSLWLCMIHFQVGSCCHTHFLQCGLSLVY